MRWIALSLVMVLAACAPSLQPRGRESVTPVMSDQSITMRDGVALPLKVWNADGAPRAVIVALHGMSDYSNAFAIPARVWAKAGIVTLAYDQRGFGAGPDPGVWAGADVMRADLNDAVAAAHARYPGLPVFALGESMGGAVVLTALASAQPPAVEGAVLVAPAVWSRGDMPLSYRVALFLGAHLLPGLVLSNSAGARIAKVVASDNVPMLIALGKDPLFQKRTRVGTVYGLVNLMDEARHAVPADPPPLLLLTGGNDQIIPKAPTDAVIAALGGKAAVKRYPNGYHMLLRDLAGDAVSQDIADWALRSRN